jgi:hypothetical protein
MTFLYFMISGFRLRDMFITLFFGFFIMVIGILSFTIVEIKEKW